MTLAADPRPMQNTRAFSKRLPIQDAHFDPTARKRTVSLTLNGDLYAKAKSAGINVSQIAEEALANALSRRLAGQARAEIKQDIQAYSLYVAEHGSPAELARAHYRAGADAT